MKIRISYVSNSSSSSYIIEFKKYDDAFKIDDEFSISVEEFLNCIQDNWDEESNVEYQTKNEDGREHLIKYLEESLEWVCDDNLKKEIEKTIKSIKTSKNEFAKISISYSNPLSKKILKLLEKKNKLKVMVSYND